MELKPQVKASHDINSPEFSLQRCQLNAKRANT